MARKGRPPDPIRQQMKAAFRYAWSDRTFSRFYMAVQRITRYEGQTAAQGAVERCQRTSGWINVSALEREAEKVMNRHGFVKGAAASVPSMYRR